jgi:hypothetical protein
LLLLLGLLQLLEVQHKCLCSLRCQRKQPEQQLRYAAAVG